MSSTRERIQAVVNSSKRLNTVGATSTDFKYRFNKTFTRVTEILIQSIQFPFSFYAINSSNNQIVINRGGLNTVLIPPGNYSATSLIATLNVALNNATDPVTGYPYNGFPGETFAVTYSSVTLKFTIKNNNPFTIFSISSDPNSTMAYNLGFQSNAVSTIIGGQHTVIGDSAAILSGPQYIRIESDFLSAPTQHKPLYADNSYNKTLFILPVNAGFGAFVSTDIQIPIRLTYKFTVKNTDEIDFRVVDQDGNLLNLNGLDWSMYLIMVTE
jgi:hypothetical protein